MSLPGAHTSVLAATGVAWHLFSRHGSLRVVRTHRGSSTWRTLLLGTCLCALVVASGVHLWRTSWPRVVRRASSSLVALGAPIGFPIAVVPFPTPGACAPGFTGWLGGARGDRLRTRLIAPRQGRQARSALYLLGAPPWDCPLRVPRATVLGWVRCVGWRVWTWSVTRLVSRTLRRSKGDSAGAPGLFCWDADTFPCGSDDATKRAYLLQYVHNYPAHGHERSDEYVQMNAAETEIIHQGLSVYASHQITPATTRAVANTTQEVRNHAYQLTTPRCLTVFFADTSGSGGLTPAASGAALELRPETAGKLRQHHLTGTTIFRASSHCEVKTLTIIVDAISTTHGQPEDHPTPRVGGSQRSSGLPDNTRTSQAISAQINGHRHCTCGRHNTISQGILSYT